MDKRLAFNAALALQVSTWLQAKGCTVQVVYVPPLTYEVHYTLKLDMKPQPPVRINGSVVFPKGSQEEVIMAYLLDGMS